MCSPLAAQEPPNPRSAGVSGCGLRERPAGVSQRYLGATSAFSLAASTLQAPPVGVSLATMELDPMCHAGRHSSWCPCQQSGQRIRTLLRCQAVNAAQARAVSRKWWGSRIASPVSRSIFRTPVKSNGT